MSIKFANGSEIIPIEIGENYGCVRGRALTDEEVKQMIYQENIQTQIRLNEASQILCEWIEEEYGKE